MARRPSIADMHWESGLDDADDDEASQQQQQSSYNSMADEASSDGDDIDEEHTALSPAARLRQRHQARRQQLQQRRQQKQPHQQHQPPRRARNNSAAMDVIEALPETGGAQPTATPRGRVVAVKLPPAPPVFIDPHYDNLYSEYLNMKIPEDDEEEERVDDSSSSSSSDDDDDDAGVTRGLSRLRIDPGGGGGNKRSRREMDEWRETDDEATDTSTPRAQHHRRRQRIEPVIPGACRGECFLCAWTNEFHDRYKAKHVHKMHAIMDNYGGCHNIELARQLHLYFMKRVYKPGLGMTVFTARCALEHIEGLHSLSALIFLGESIKKWTKIKFCLENQICRADGTYNRGAVKDALDAQKMLNTLYQMKLEGMNFNFGKSSEDTKRMGRTFNFMEEFKPERARQDRQKKKRKTRGASSLVNTGDYADL